VIVTESGKTTARRHIRLEFIRDIAASKGRP
jgi:hypothetical protein